jgi:hypothetical protein
MGENRFVATILMKSVCVVAAYTMLSESRCALRLRYGMGSGLYRRSWTSRPTPFISAQRLSESTVQSVC